MNPLDPATLKLCATLLACMAQQSVDPLYVHKAVVATQPQAVEVHVDSSATEETIAAAHHCGMAAAVAIPAGDELVCQFHPGESR